MMTDDNQRRLLLLSVENRPCALWLVLKSAISDQTFCQCQIWLDLAKWPCAECAAAIAKIHLKPQPKYSIYMYLLMKNYASGIRAINDCIRERIISLVLRQFSG